MSIISDRDSKLAAYWFHPSHKWVYDEDADCWNGYHGGMWCKCCHKAPLEGDPCYFELPNEAYEPTAAAMLECDRNLE